MSFMRLSPLVRLIPPEPVQHRRRRGWVIGVSLLLHALLLAALLTVPRRPEQDEGASTSYELQFEGAQSGDATHGAPQSVPQGTPETAPTPSAGPPPPPTSSMEVLPGPPTPPADAPPAPDTSPQPPAPIAPDLPRPTDEPLATPAPPAEAPPLPPLAAPAPPTPAPSSAAPPATSPAPPAVITADPAPLPPPVQLSRPEVRLEQPPPEPPPRPLVPDLVLPTPPMPLPQARVVPPRPRPLPPPAPATGTFANPMDLNFGSAPTRLAAPRLTAPRGSVASRSLDLSPGQSRSTPSRADAFFDARAAKLGADWEGSLKAYWLRHRYYPRQAAEDGEDGTVELELTVDGSGRVRSATVKSRSGSTWIDMAAVGTWRNAQLAPLPPELATPYTFSITINYILLR